MRRNVGVILGLILTCTLQAQELKYPVSTIPDSLIKNVNAVFRLDEMTFTIESRSKATEKIHKVITILNATGKRFAQEVVGYDNLRKVTFNKGNIYNGSGQLINKLKNSEIIDQSAVDGLYGDARFKGIDLTQSQYPYTVEIEYEVEYKFIFYFPSFYVLGGEKTSVERSKCQFVYPKTMTPRFKTVNISQQPVVTNFGAGMESKTWHFSQVKPITLEPMAGDSRNQFAYIEAAPLFIEYDSYSGKMDTWDNFGLWIISLNKGRDILLESTRKEVRNLTASSTTVEEKVKKVYEYMQGKTRYVSIQLGIGGYQPFEASVVDKTGYGDCKALSNYMVAMLSDIGIKAHYVLIYAGENAPALDVGFPSTQFNHATVAVPNGRDTLWLECTSQTNPFGYTGTFTGNRTALAITDNGAKVVRTPHYTADVNTQVRKAQVTVAGDGNAKATIKTKYSGLNYESEGLSFILEDQFDEQKKWVEKTTDIPSFNINSFKIENQKAKIPTAIVNLDLQLNRYASVNGKRMFLTPNLMTKTTYIPPKVENRKSDVVIRSGFFHIDSIHYSIPENIYAESLPESKKFNSSFGEYEAHFKLDQGKLLYIRKFRMKEGTYPAKTYDELIEFTKNINKADNTKVVFVNKT